mmetsp:Transcript_32833/g.39336  ORF Transcript_32833/g.39336 Transcript_32833/m.39336 type:complete len:93 (+) Transcript_32833:96-374(+)|eukprot:CAMPEP_0198260882 /NCGR_PEP_ID=MMETSP1447-20131203/9737_1 /TAXON_ID=420782 /ORGANISM="Chaetoceros dichaeta, Strain CCMP1751" /LENGTH=92 /DNA_ID=CAMNT_0043948639 /DNA_START=94 /DNA_END=372 /DNA_ORIENTATION=+
MTTTQNSALTMSSNSAERGSFESCDSSSSMSQSGGWGNAESRKSYACLPSLVDQNTSIRQIEPRHIDREGWGHFADTTDNLDCTKSSNICIQ